jgi:hypothetical protein
MSAQSTTLRKIMFELGGGGGGSFWADDYLLATLTIQLRANRQGRVSLRDGNRALDIVCHSSRQRREYRLLEGARLLARAEWLESAPTARVSYGGRDYAAGATGLFSITPEFDEQPVVGLDLPVDWHGARLMLLVQSEADLPLVVFYSFIAYDLVQAEAKSQSPQLDKAA